MGHIRTDGGYGKQVRRILDEQAGKAMIRVIVGGAVSDHQVGVGKSG